VVLHYFLTTIRDRVHIAFVEAKRDLIHWVFLNDPEE
jgi:hypothetical protein